MLRQYRRPPPLAQLAVRVIPAYSSEQIFQSGKNET
jgi:hypothetical protein